MWRITLVLLLIWPGAALAQETTVRAALVAYALYQQDVTDLLGANITSPEAMDDALARAARHDPARVSRGWIAYGALTAAQSPAFVAGVRSRVRAAGRAAVLRQLRRDVTYARRRPPGAAEAIQLILSASAADGARIVAAGERYRGIAEAMDAGAWAEHAAPDRAGRQTQLRASAGATRTLAPELAAHLVAAPLSAAPLTDADAFGGARFWDAAAGRASPPPPAFRWAPARPGVVDKMLTLAGIVIVDASASEPARVAAMMDDPASRDCLALEQLEFRQCASVAHDPNEDAFCLALHGLSGPGQCFANVARAS